MAKGQQRDLKREAFWRGVMMRFGGSGLTGRAFCVRERLSEPSFYAWRRVIRQRDAEVSQPAFVPVVAAAAAAVHAAAVGHAREGIEIEWRGGGFDRCVVRLPAALPTRQVAELVHAIAAPGAARAETDGRAEMRGIAATEVRA